VAFQIRANLEVMKELGITIDELILFGGGAHSALWSQIICDVTRKPLSITAMVDVANWGACLLAGIGAGLFDRSDFLRSEARVQRPQRFPRPEVAEQYDGIYQLYRTHEEQLLVKTALQAGGG
jgi:xylulokinase